MGPSTGAAPTQLGSALIIYLEGAVTGSACPGLRDAVLRRLPEGVNHVLIDASAVTAIDDAVFSVLLAGGAWLRTRGGRIGFLTASASVRRPLASLGLSSLLPVLGRHAAAALRANLTRSGSEALQALSDVAPLAIPADVTPGIPGSEAPTGLRWRSRGSRPWHVRVG